MQKLVGSRTRPRGRDVETAVLGEIASISGAVLEPLSTARKPSPGMRGKNETLDLDEVESYHTAAGADQRPSTRDGLAALATASDSSPRLLSDEENERMNRKIDKLMAAIDDHRPIHFAPDAETGEVEIFADHYGQEIDRDEHELERNIDASPENYGRIIGVHNGIHRVESPNSLRYAASSDSWASTDSKKSSSNAWERAVAAANIRFAIEHGGPDQEDTVIRHPFRSSARETKAHQVRRQVRTMSPIPLDFNKRIRASTPSVHSTGTEMDTSSPLFRRSCERIRWETYAELPESMFQRESPKHSRLDEWAFVLEPREVPLPDTRESKAPSSTGRAFGVFEDGPNGECSSKKTEKPALRSKVLKDISNLRRPGHLHSNSFAKDANLADAQISTAVPATGTSFGFGGAVDPASRRAYIKPKWPGLLVNPDNNSMAEAPRLDGAARRRNEQVIGHPIDRSHYSLSHVRTSVADSSLNADPSRQAHFDLALARLEGRALPPPPSPIHRHPDSAALFDWDIQTEGSHRPLPLRGPRPSRPANSTPHASLRRYLNRKDELGH